jgi:large subunit ribosomal protein L22
LLSNMMVEARAQLSGLHISPRKVRLLADLVRGKSVADAKMQLIASKKHAARPMLKLIDSAVANASHNHMADVDTLKIITVFVNEGRTMKRWMPKAMGRATRINKRTSHVTLVLSGEGKEATVQPTEETKEVAVESETAAPAKKKAAPKKKATEKKPAKKTTKKADKKSE